MQSVHAPRPSTGSTHHDALPALYGLLATRCPNGGVPVARAAAMVEAGAPRQAAVGEPPAAERALPRAVGLTEDPAVRS